MTTHPAVRIQTSFHGIDPHRDHTSMGVLNAFGAYIAWGLLPVYWRLLQHVPATEVLTHRIVWSFVTLLPIVLLLRRPRAAFTTALRDWRLVRLYALAGALVAVGWVVYVWAVNAGHIVETSLGYYITPLANVVLAVFFLGERLRPVQWIAIAIAAAGVLILAVDYGQPPWIALVLALSASLYALVKKRAPLGALEGLTLETGVLGPLALVYLVYLQLTPGHAFLVGSTLDDLLLIGTGIATATPLLFFAGAARRIPLSLIGIIQYLAPTITFLLGVLVYGESLSTGRLIGFCVVWSALVLFAAESIVARRRRPAADTAIPEPVDL